MLKDGMVVNKRLQFARELKLRGHKAANPERQKKKKQKMSLTKTDRSLNLFIITKSHRVPSPTRSIGSRITATDGHPELTH